MKKTQKLFICLRSRSWHIHFIGDFCLVIIHTVGFEKLLMGTLNKGFAPTPLTGEQVYEQVKDINCEFGKPYKALDDQSCYKKMSAFWVLLYWKDLYVRHCVDVMHVEKKCV